MLILTRKSGEAIRIGDQVTLKIIEIRGNQVRLGVEAPRDLEVHREEIYALIQRRAEAQPDPEPTTGETDWAVEEWKTPAPVPAKDDPEGPA